MRSPTDSADPRTPVALFEIGSRSLLHPDPAALSPLSLPLDPSLHPLTSSTGALAPGSEATRSLSTSLPPTPTPSSAVLTFTSTPAPPPPTLPAVVVPVLSCYYAVREWLAAGLLAEGSGEWAAADLQYRQARTLCDLLREEVNGSGGAGGRDAELLNTMAEQIDLRVHAVAGEVRGEVGGQDEGGGGVAAVDARDEAWRAEDDAVYGSNISAEA